MWVNGLLLLSALLVTTVAVLVFMFATRTGQFEDVEEAKFTMLRSEDKEPGSPTSSHPDPFSNR